MATEDEPLKNIIKKAMKPWADVSDYPINGDRRLVNKKRYKSNKYSYSINQKNHFFDEYDEE